MPMHTYYNNLPAQAGFVKIAAGAICEIVFDAGTDPATVHWCKTHRGKKIEECGCNKANADERFEYACQWRTYNGEGWTAFADATWAFSRKTLEHACEVVPAGSGRVQVQMKRAGEGYQTRYMLKLVSATEAKAAPEFVEDHGMPDF